MIKQILEKLKLDSKGNEITGVNYTVSYGFDGLIEAPTPENAIEWWVELQENDGMDVVIYASDQKNIKNFYEWCRKNEKKFIKIVKEQRYYKTDYLLDKVKKFNYKKLKYEYDALEPFSVG